MDTLRPLDLGELLDRSVNFWRANWRPLFRLMLAFQLVEFILVTAAQGLNRWAFPLAQDFTAIKQAPQAALPHMLGSVLVLGVAIVGSLLVSQFAGVAATHYAFSRLARRGAPTAGDAFRHAAARLGTASGAFALSLGWTLLVLLLLLLPGLLLGGLAAWLAVREQLDGALAAGIAAAVLAGLGMVVLVLWFVVRFILLSQVIAVEPVGPLAAFRRSDALSSGRVLPGALGLVKVRLTVLVTVIGVVLLIVGTLGNAPLLVAGAVYDAGFEAGRTVTDVLPLAVLVPLQLFQTVLGALTAPLYAVFQAFFYADMRARREGLDLELALGV